MLKSKLSKNCVLIFILFSYILFYRFFLIKNALKYSEAITAAFTILLSLISIIMYGIMKDKQTLIKKTIRYDVIFIILLFFALSYFLGLFFGFLRTSFSIKINLIIDNILPQIFIIVFMEVFRYVLISNNKNNNKFILLLTILLSLFEINLNISTIHFNDILAIVKVITSVILPCIAKNLLLSYLAYNAGFIPGIIYRLVMDLYIYILPIVPNLGDYLNSLIYIFLPLTIYIKVSKTLSDYYNGIERKFNKDFFQVMDIPVFVLVFTLLFLSSRAFPYYIMGVGSESMNPVIHKGDAIIVHKIKFAKEIKKGDIIVFKNSKDNKSYIHRLVKIERKNDRVYYRTKGDSNNAIDGVNTEFSDIEGKVTLKIRYIAYPTIYLKEQFAKN